MKFISSLIAAAAALALVPAAHAVSLQGGAAQTVAGNLVDDFSTDGLLSFDLGLQTLQPVTLNFVVGANDGGSLPFAALVSNFLGYNVQSLNISLGNGVTFDMLGTAIPAFNSATVGLLNGSEALVSVAGVGEGVHVELGNVFGDTPGATDWMLNLNGLQAGQSFSMTITTAVPEPSAIAMVLAGLGVAAGVARRRQT